MHHTPSLPASEFRVHRARSCLRLDMSSGTNLTGVAIATAGHVDHGKSSLVRALTGTDPDRLPEERRRGMTIDVGFASTRLPSGRVAAFLDVPGHERFVSNMVVGAAGADYGLLVVAADEGVMPQTREHLQVLNVLGLPVRVVALTKMDVAGGEMTSLAIDEVQDLFVRTGQAGPLIVRTSTLTGQGLPDLLAALDTLPDRRCEEPDFVHVAVDRVFSLPGFGAVVTGTVRGGVLEEGATLELLPSHRRVRVRGIQSHGDQTRALAAGQRAGINLQGVTHHDMRRGDVLAEPGSFLPTRRADAWVSVGRDAPGPLRSNQEVTVHAGTADLLASLHPLTGDSIVPGSCGWAQLRFRSKAVLWRRERIVLRTLSPAVTVGGATIADTQPRRRSHIDSVRRLEGLLSSNTDMVMRMHLSQRPRTVDELAQRAAVSTQSARDALDRLCKSGEVLVVASRYASQEWLSRMALAAGDEVARYHDRFPLRVFMPREELRSRLRVGHSEFQAVMRVVENQARGKTVGLHMADNEASQLVIDSSSAGSAPTDTGDVEGLIHAIREAEFSPGNITELARQHDVSTESLRRLRDLGRLVRVSASIYLTQEQWKQLQALVGEYLVRQDRATVAEIRDLLKTSRKYALAYLEALDEQRFTRRVGDERVLMAARAHRT